MAKIPINISLVAVSNLGGLASAASVNLSNAGKTKGYFDLFDAQSNASVGVTTASNADWSNAWKEQQRQNEKRNRPSEHATDPSPLLVDIISTLPAGSSRRRNYENLKLTLDGDASNVGHGLDAMTRESYQDVRRLSKQSEMLQQALQEPLPTQDQIIGSEEGQAVSNIQSWKPAFANANKNVSDALGSHADMDHSIAKDAAGPAAFLPTSASYLMDKTTPFLTNEVEGGFKHNQMEMLKHLPSKVAGSMRQLSTALDSVLSVPFEIASDVYNGLRMLMTQLSDLLDAIKTKLMKWGMSLIGGLVDGLFPEGLLDGVIQAVSSIAGEFSSLFDMLGGFSIVGKIKDVFSSILSGNFMSAIKSVAGLAGLLASGLGSGALLGGLAGKSIDCIERQLGLSKSGKLNKNVAKGIALAGILGFLPMVGKGLGNLGSIIGKGLKGLVGSAISNIRNLGGLIAGLLPVGLGYIMNKLLGKLCGVGITGNNGYSVGSIFDNHRDNTFQQYMSSYAAHASIIGPLFNKQTVPKGTYSGEANISTFDDSPYAKGTQSSKGMTMVGPGGSLSYKPFGAFQSNRTTNRQSPSSMVNLNMMNQNVGLQAAIAF